VGKRRVREPLNRNFKKEKNALGEGGPEGKGGKANKRESPRYKKNRYSSRNM